MKDFADRALVIACAVLVLVFGIGIYILPSEDFSERENRALADFPKFTLGALTDGSFARALGSFGFVSNQKSKVKTIRLHQS